MIISPEGAKRPVSTKAWDIAFQKADVTHIEEGTSEAPLRAVFVEMKQAGPYGTYSGGGENFVRFMEDWTGKTFTYYGSMLNLFTSSQGVGAWGSANTYLPPTQNWYFDSTLSIDANGDPVSVPGYVSTVAYLQQQRWYLQY